MLPMGTIVTACMIIGLLVAAPLPLLQKLPGALQKGLATLVLVAGLWNVLWYALQHLGEFWGVAALVSGLLMIVTALYVLAPSRLPVWLIQAKWGVLVGLLACAVKYATTIASL